MPGRTKSTKFDASLFDEMEKTLYSPVISDILDDFGVRAHTLNEKIKPLERDYVVAGRAATQRRVVVLPQPEGPRMTTNSPLETSRERPSTAAAPSNFLTRFTRRSSLILFAYVGFGLKNFCNLQSATDAAATYFDGRWIRFFFSIPAAAVHRLPMIILPVCPQSVNASYLLMR